MGLYRALREVLVDDGPLDYLHPNRLPPSQVGDVDVAFVPRAGTPVTRSLGSRPVFGGAEGVTHDGGVEWYHTGAQFQCRHRDPDDSLTAFGVAEDIRDVLVQFAGEGFTAASERIVRMSIATAPYFYAEDRRGRALCALVAEVWHHREWNYGNRFLIGGDAVLIGGDSILIGGA